MIELERKIFRVAEDHRIAITIADPDSDDCPLVFANRAFSELTGYSNDDIIGRNCRFLQGEKTNPDEVAGIRAAVRQRAAHTCCLLNYRADDSSFHNLLYLDEIKVAADKSYLIGCQYEFSRMITHIEAEERVTSVSSAILDLSMVRRDAALMSKRALMMRSQSALHQMKNHMVNFRNRNLRQ